MLGSHRSAAIIEVRRLATKLHDGCACTVCWLAVLLKLKLVPHLCLDKEILNIRVIDNLLKYMFADNCHNR